MNPQRLTIVTWIAFIAMCLVLIVATINRVHASPACPDKIEARDNSPHQHIYYTTNIDGQKCWYNHRNHQFDIVESSTPPQPESAAVDAPPSPPPMAAPLPIEQSPLAQYRPAILDLTPVAPAAADDTDQNGGIWPETNEKKPAAIASIKENRSQLIGFAMMTIGVMFVFATILRGRQEAR